MGRIVVAIAALVFVMMAIGFAPAFGREAKPVREFRYSNPCPETGKRWGSCPGWVVDHIHPLCAGGPDKAWNMQWQRVAESREKDAREMAYCRCIKRGESVCVAP